LFLVSGFHHFDCGFWFLDFMHFMFLDFLIVFMFVGAVYSIAAVRLSRFREFMFLRHG
jgi:hypothetical protein